MSADLSRDAASIGLDGEYREADLPLLAQRRGMAYWAGDHVRILDRRQLPMQVVELACGTVADVAEAIENMAIQGAFTLAIAAGYGMALAVRHDRSSAGTGGPLAAVGGAESSVRESARNAAARLLRTRPTGLALRRMLEATQQAILRALDAGEDPERAVVVLVEAQAARWAQQALATARHALPLIPEGAGLLTHCFADRSFLYLLLEARTAGRMLEVYCDETRPYLQGARLTALSVQQIGHRATVITDGMGAFLMRERKIGAFVTAADRVCMDGTICNKIGTYANALAARANGLPYYVLRQSGPDLESAGEADIHVEYRNPEAVLEFEGVRTAPPGVGALYPAFDITPPELVTAIVTDRGVFAPAAMGDYVVGAHAET